MGKNLPMLIATTNKAFFLKVCYLLWLRIYPLLVLLLVLFLVTEYILLFVLHQIGTRRLNTFPYVFFALAFSLTSRVPMSSVRPNSFLPCFREVAKFFQVGGSLPAAGNTHVNCSSSFTSVYISCVCSITQRLSTILLSNSCSMRYNSLPASEISNLASRASHNSLAVVEMM